MILVTPVEHQSAYRKALSVAICGEYRGRDFVGSVVATGSTQKECLNNLEKSMWADHKPVKILSQK